MGWSTYHRSPGQTDREHFAAEMNPDSEILDCATVKSVFYAAVRNKTTGQVWAWVCLIQRTPKDPYYNFGYKSMDETVGPNATDCPARILDLLTPTDSKWANEWRESCRKTIAAKAEARKTSSAVTDGTIIRMAKVLNFRGGLEAQEFKLRVSGRTRRWVANPGTDGAFVCRLPQDWATRYTWEKISA